jgi:predicted dehydrogenase
MKRIGLVGAGWVTQHHLDGYRALKDRVRVVAIADPSEAARTRRASEYDIAATYPDAASMLAAENLDAVDVACPREFHAPVCLQVAAKGLPILCQKPLAPTLALAERLVRDIGGRVRLMVHENWRFRPHYRAIRRWIDEGRIGRIRQAIMLILASGFVRDARGKLPAVERQLFFATLDRLLVAEAMIHQIDTLRFLVGPLRLDAAHLGRSVPGLKGEDRCALMMSVPSGPPAVLFADFVAHGRPPLQTDHLELLGEEGAIRLSGNVLELFGKRPERVELDLEANYKASYRDTIAHFLDRLEDGKPFETAPEDNLQTLRIVEEAYAAEGRA